MNEVIDIIVSIVTLGLGGLIVAFLIILNDAKNECERGNYERENKRTRGASESKENNMGKSSKNN